MPADIIQNKSALLQEKLKEAKALILFALSALSGEITPYLQFSLANVPLIVLGFTLPDNLLFNNLVLLLIGVVFFILYKLYL